MVAAPPFFLGQAYYLMMNLNPMMKTYSSGPIILTVEQSIGIISVRIVLTVSIVGSSRIVHVNIGLNHLQP